MNNSEIIDQLKSKYPHCVFRLMGNNHEYFLKIDLISGDAKIRLYKSGIYINIITINIFIDNIGNMPFIIVSTKNNELSNLIINLQNYLDTMISSDLNIIELIEMAERFLHTYKEDYSTLDKSGLFNKKSTKLNEYNIKQNRVENICKKKRMKSAFRVINRIIWDNRLKNYIEFFKIGYMDAYKRIVEDYIANNTIPTQSILYIKVKNIV